MTSHQAHEGRQEPRQRCGQAGAAEPHREAPPDLELLIPIAVVIAGGCEPCARCMVDRALEGGASPRHIRKTLGLVDHMRRQDCYAESIGAAGIARMERPLATARRSLEAR